MGEVVNSGGRVTSSKATTRVKSNEWALHTGKEKAKLFRLCLQVSKEAIRSLDTCLTFLWTEVSFFFTKLSTQSYSLLSAINEPLESPEQGLYFASPVNGGGQSCSRNTTPELGDIRALFVKLLQVHSCRHG